MFMGALSVVQTLSFLFFTCDSFQHLLDLFNVFACFCKLFRWDISSEQIKYLAETVKAFASEVTALYGTAAEAYLA